jgi:hypothetical protein
MTKLKTAGPAGWALVGSALCLLLAGDVVVTYYAYTSRFPGANDFASRWGGARAFWRDGLSPYSDEATQQIQLLIYGRSIPPEEEQQYDPGPFAYPFFTVFLLFPLVWLPYAWAESVWLVLLEVFLVLGVLLSARLARWRMPAWLLVCTLVWSLTFYPDARALILGQFSVFVFAMVASTLWALGGRRDKLAGICLALSTVKPQMVFLLVPLMLAWALVSRRYRFIAFFLGAIGLLLGLSWLLEPAWASEFISQVERYTSYTAIGSPIWIVAHSLIPSLGSLGEWALTGLALLYLAIAAYRSLRDRGGVVSLWLVGLCLIVTNLVALRTATSNYVVLLLPLAMVFAAVHGYRRGPWLVLLMQLALLVGMWAHFLVTVEGKFEHPAVYLPLPLALLVVFGLGRRWIEVGCAGREVVEGG